MSQQLSAAALAALNRAALLIAGERALDDVLQQIADSARALLNARYAALGVADADGELAQFITSGISADQAAALPHPPRGDGLLGRLISDAVPIRVNDLASDRRSTGFPHHHPPMRAFLGVPLLVDGEPAGHLYLTDKLDGTPFTDTDQVVVEMLAAHAATAIGKARLIEAAERQTRRLQAISRAAVLVAAELNLDKVLQHIVDTVRTLANARYAALGIPDEKGRLHTFVTSGIAPEEASAMGPLPEGHGLLGAVIRDGVPLRVDAIARDARASGFPAGHPPMHTFLGVPLLHRGECVGNLYLTDKEGGLPFDEADVELLETFAAHAAVAIENARLVGEAEHFAITEERNRIGMDLHDGVIQSIYAVGLVLESVRFVTDGDDEADALLTTAIDGLNSAIGDIRNYIMGLRPRSFRGDLRQGLAQLVREFQANTMIPATLAVEVDTAALPPALSRALYLTAQEALSNVARHAKATTLAVTLSATPQTVKLSIVDDGRGFDTAATDRRIGHGLANMRRRISTLGGRCVIDSAPGRGTSVELSVPNSN